MKIKFLENISSKNLIMVLFDDYQSGSLFNFLNSKLNNLIADIITKQKIKTGENRDLTIFLNDKDYDSITLITVDKKNNFDRNQANNLGGRILNIIKKNKFENSSIIAENLVSEIAFGLSLKNYKFDKYKSKKQDSDFQPLLVEFVCQDYQENHEKFASLEKIVDSVNFAKDLVTEPSNILYPETISNKVFDELSKLDIKVRILSEVELQDLGMGALLAVGQGSTKPSKVVVMEYFGKDDTSDPIILVGKGVTFDTGGISLKPAQGMEKMKYDMGGSAVVAGAIRGLGAMKADVNAVGIVGFVENMPDGNAIKPGDVVKSMSGKTIEVLNTDAEGRLVLADCLWYAHQNYKPKYLVDFATLTGAIIYALGNEYAGLFSNDDNLAEKLIKSGAAVNEKLWQFPLHSNYDKEMNSNIADMQNISKTPGAGSITAGQFLKRFVKDIPWAHIDIAGVTWNNSSSDISEKGSTAFGVRLAIEFILKNYV